MKITKEDLKYLSGEKFDIDYHMHFTDEVSMGREETIIDIVKGKNVIHVGCCDHINVIDEKVKNNTWLHGILNEKCNKVIGLDINKEAIDYIKKKKYANNVVYNDIIVDKPVKMDEEYDYMILGEILEHVDNPVQFLESIQKKYVGKVKSIIISVPNALKYCTLNNIKYEGINSDHKYYFTPYTLSKILYDSGFKPKQILFADAYKSVNFLGLVHVVKCKPQFGMTIIGIADFEKRI